MIVPGWHPESLARRHHTRGQQEAPWTCAGPGVPHHGGLVPEVRSRHGNELLRQRRAVSSEPSSLRTRYEANGDAPLGRSSPRRLLRSHGSANFNTRSSRPRSRVLGPCSVEQAPVEQAPFALAQGSPRRTRRKPHRDRGTGDLNLPTGSHSRGDVFRTSLALDRGQTA